MQVEESTLSDNQETVTAAINKIWVQYCATMCSGDIDGWIALWADDGIQLAPDAPANVGKEQIRAATKSVLDLFSFNNMTINNAEVEWAGEWAFARGTYAATLVPTNGDEAIPVDGKYMSIFKKQADGSWKLYRDCFNSNG